MKNKIRFPATACVLAMFTSFGASTAPAVTAEVAKKCNAAMAKAFPPRQPGNPAAGSSKGSGNDERAYFRKCVANDGNPPSDETPKK